MDAVKNFAWSTVATAPSPATTGTSLTVAAGDGTRYPTVPFNASVFPAGTIPTPANAEIVRVTARTTDVLTITRTQEGSSARAIGIGDQIAAAITAKTLTDLVANPMLALGDVITGAAAGVPQRLAIGATNTVLTVVGGIPTWATLPIDPGFANPMTAGGDLITGGASGVPGRLGIGSAGQILTVSGGMPTWAATIATSNPSLSFSKTASGQSAAMVGQTNQVTRWQLLLGDTVSETGANAGSNFTVNSFSDAGAYLATPFTLVRPDITNPIQILAGGLYRQLTLGATDSGGAGFRMVRVPN